jgi:hypothetical protein
VVSFLLCVIQRSATSDASTFRLTLVCRQRSIMACLRSLLASEARLFTLCKRASSSKPSPASRSADGGDFKGASSTEWGSPVFRTLNFELYTKAEGSNKTAAYIGSSVFLGIMGYFTYMGWRADQPGHVENKAQAPAP